MRSMTLATLMFGGALVFAAEGAVAKAPLSYDQRTLVQVEALYGIDEDAAITRLAREYDAAVQARAIRERHLPGFAGAWFDADSQVWS